MVKCRHARNYTLGESWCWLCILRQFIHLSCRSEDVEEKKSWRAVIKSQLWRKVHCFRSSDSHKQNCTLCSLWSILLRIEAPPLVTSQCHRQANFSPGVLVGSQSFGRWFDSSFHILLFYMLKKLPCPVGYDSGHGLMVLLSESKRLCLFPTATAVIINHQVNITFEASYTCCSLSRLCPFGIQHQSVS